MAKLKFNTWYVENDELDRFALQFDWRWHGDKEDEAGRLTITKRAGHPPEIGTGFLDLEDWDASRLIEVTKGPRGPEVDAKSKSVIVKKMFAYMSEA